MAEFFRLALRSYSDGEIIDTIAARYGWTYGQIEDLTLPQLATAFGKCKEAKQRAEARQEWVALLPFMSIQWLKYMDFEAYYDKVCGRDLDLRPKEEILREVEEIRKQMRAENGSV